MSWTDLFHLQLCASQQCRRLRQDNGRGAMEMPTAAGALARTCPAQRERQVLMLTRTACENGLACCSCWHSEVPRLCLLRVALQPLKKPWLGEGGPSLPSLPVTSATECNVCYPCSNFTLTLQETSKALHLHFAKHFAFLSDHSF